MEEIGNGDFLRATAKAAGSFLLMQGALLGQVQSAATEPDFMRTPMVPHPLWNAGEVPLAKGSAPHDAPSLRPFLAHPDYASGAAVLVITGGGYAECTQPRGYFDALWFNEQGISAFVLEYRTGANGYRHPAMLLDAQRAMRYIRANAQAFQIDPRRLGVIGASAGGHLAATLLNYSQEGNPDAADLIERESSKPDFVILRYPVISMRDGITHLGSRRNLLGEHPAEEQIRELSAEENVRAENPPVLIIHALDDKVVPPRNSELMYQALKDKGADVEAHFYPNGAHGFGLGKKGNWVAPDLRHPWVRDAQKWLKAHGFSK